MLTRPELRRLVTMHGTSNASALNLIQINVALASKGFALMGRSFVRRASSHDGLQYLKAARLGGLFSSDPSAQIQSACRPVPKSNRTVRCRTADAGAKGGKGIKATDNVSGLKHGQWPA